VASREPWDFMHNVQCRTGAFEPGIAVEALRDSGDHLIADMIEGMADYITELEVKVATLMERPFDKSKRKRKRS
jgi:hypothetical protein